MGRDDRGDEGGKGSTGGFSAGGPTPPPKIKNQGGRKTRGGGPEQGPVGPGLFSLLQEGIPTLLSYGESKHSYGNLTPCRHLQV